MNMLYRELYSTECEADDVNKALLMAAKSGRLECLKLLLSHDLSDVNVWETTKFAFYNCTPLMLATKGGYFECIEQLVKAGADLNSMDWSSETALLKAIRQNDIDSTKILILAGTDPEVKDETVSKNMMGHLYLHAAVFSQNETLVELVLSMKNISVVETQKDFLLFSAVHNRTHKILEMLLQSGASINVENGRRWSPLMAALENDDLNCIQVLLAYKPDVNYEVKVYDGAEYLKSDSALQIATKYNYIESVKLLLQHGADAGIGQGGPLSLYYAIGNGNLECVEELVEAGADVNTLLIMDGRLDPHIPLVVALINNHFDIAEYLYNKMFTADQTSYLFYAKKVVQDTDPDQNRHYALTFTFDTDVCISAAKWLRGHGAVVNNGNELESLSPPSQSAKCARFPHSPQVKRLSVLAENLGHELNLMDNYGHTILSRVLNQYVRTTDCVRRQLDRYVIYLVQQGVNVNQPVLCYREPANYMLQVDTKVAKVNLELPLEMAVRCYGCRLAKMLWEAGSKPGNVPLWHQNNIPWYGGALYLHYMNLQTVVNMQDLMFCFLKNTVQQPRGLADSARMIIREQLQMNWHHLPKALCFKELIRHLPVPIHLQQYIELAYLDDIG